MSQNSAGEKTPPMEYDQDLKRAAMKNDTTNLKQKLGPNLPVCHEFLAMLLFLALQCHSHDFVVELLRLKPELIWAEDSNGQTVMHISCEHGFVRIVLELTNLFRILCHVRDNQGRNPVHIAAANGRVEVLQALAMSCPNSLMELTPSNETALQVAVKHRQVECFRVLMEQCPEQNRFSQLNWRDNDGNTVYDIATSTDQKQILQMLSLHKTVSWRHFQSLQQQLPKITESMIVAQTILVFMGGVAFAGLGNYRNMFRPEHQARTATFSIKDIISAPNILPLGFYYIAFITEVFIVSMITMYKSISAPGILWAVCYTEVVLFLVLFLLLAFLLMVKLFVPHFFMRIMFSLTISSFWFVLLLDVTFVLVLVPVVFIVKKILYIFRGRKMLFLGEKEKNEVSALIRNSKEEQVDKKTAVEEARLDIT